MKTYVLLLSLLTLVTSCDAPQRTRLPTVYDNGLTNPNDTSGSLPSNTTGSTGGGGTTGTTGSTSGGTTTGFENCDLSYKYHSVDTGHFGICQSTSDETLFKFKSSTTNSSSRTCLIPTYKESNGSSTYIGQPQCTYTEADKIVQGKLYKNRSGFSNYALNGVLVMKESLLPEYFGCMQAYTNWPGNICSGTSNSYCIYWGNGCPAGGKSSVACDAEAKNYMAQVCNSFKSKYSNSYIDIRTK